MKVNIIRTNGYPLDGFDSALLRELGEKLVETVYLALAELVKNSYDADADMVKVKFTMGEDGNDEIHIIDYGVGMNFREVKEYWMRIATTNKLEHNVSTRGGTVLEFLSLL